MLRLGNSSATTPWTHGIIFNRAPAPVAELRYNVFGFNVGGPVTFGKLYNPNKTKTFFFYNMEWRKMIQGQTLNQTVPLASTYGGDFSAVAPTLAKLHAPVFLPALPRDSGSICSRGPGAQRLYGRRS